jgi:hypothetical protein
MTSALPPTLSSVGISFILLLPIGTHCALNFPSHFYLYSLKKLSEPAKEKRKIKSEYYKVLLSSSRIDTKVL